MQLAGHWLAIISVGLTAACASAEHPTTPPPQAPEVVGARGSTGPSRAPDPQGPAVAPPTEAPQRIELVEGTAQPVGRDVVVTLRSVMYSHISGGQNESMMVLDASRGGETQRVTLSRRHPGPSEYTSVLGVKLAIDFVDAYRQPSTGAIFVEPE